MVEEVAMVAGHPLLLLVPCLVVLGVEGVDVVAGGWDAAFAVFFVDEEVPELGGRGDAAGEAEGEADDGNRGEFVFAWCLGCWRGAR